ncbi:4-hydroxy-tetrahydrodipicolinate synthase [Gluconobacter cerinus]|uniref:4-hydroxy-tetrahydrodipicolinate synthase n=1 Tax=Gluconobacter cerinus TaxID=38307 RepID=UPI0018DEB6AC|nr:4-hydroxy-tetrahydrodipicolinate synthase [Gluconobacter cerinus]
MVNFRGIMPAFPTPVFDDGKINRSVLKAYVRYLIDAGCEGLVPLGGTGESNGLTQKAREDVVATVVEAAEGKVPVVPGVLNPGYHDAVKAAQAYTREGASGLLVITPYYVHATQAGLTDYYRSFRQEVDLPILAYDIPYRTGVTLAAETLIELARDSAIAGMKACNTDIAHFNKVAAGMPEDFALLSGEDGLFPAHMLLGAKGGIIATASLNPAYWVKIFHAAQNGQYREAVSLQRALLPFLDVIFSEINPGPLRQALTMIGFDVGGTLKPLVDPEPEKQSQIRKVLKELSVIDALGTSLNA